MALNNSKTINKLDGTSVTGDYWKITKVDIDKQKMIATWTVALFLNQTVADAGGSPVGPSYQFSSTVTKAQLALDVLALGYTTISSKVAAGYPTGFHSPLSTPRQAYIDLTGATDA